MTPSSFMIGKWGPLLTHFLFSFASITFQFFFENNFLPNVLILKQNTK